MAAYTGISPAHINRMPYLLQLWETGKKPFTLYGCAIVEPRHIWRTQAEWTLVTWGCSSSLAESRGLTVQSSLVRISNNAQELYGGCKKGPAALVAMAWWEFEGGTRDCASPYCQGELRGQPEGEGLLCHVALRISKARTLWWLQEGHPSLYIREMWR